MSRFSDRVAIVTGSSSGIGLAVAERLASEGARLVLVAAPSDARDLDQAVASFSERGVAAEGLAADISDEATAKRTVDLALTRFARIDVLINNAGIAYFDEFLASPVDHLDRTLNVNVRGTFLMSLAAAREMQRGGAIVCTASTASFAGEEFQVTYNASKAAVVGLTRSMAIDLAPRGIRVNAVAPGWVATRGTRPVIADSARWSKHRSRIPLDRAAEPGEVAAVHAFLASDDASYLTGTVVVADGGLTAGYRWSNWLAAERPAEGLSVGIPELPEMLGRDFSD